jgi:predicted DsbA family dithiol-disulfide isomerase
MSSRKMTVDVWSDVVCPWCFVGKRRLDAAIFELPWRDSVEVRWHAFELDPSSPRQVEGSNVERLARKYRMPLAQAQQLIDRMTETGKADGIAFDFPRTRSGNTFDAHRLLHEAGRQGPAQQNALQERLFRAYFSEGEAVGDRETLVRLAEAAGLDGERARTVVYGDAWDEAVRADERQAASLGIGGVPFFVIDGRYGVSGAQPVELLRSALEKAWAEAPAAVAPAAVAEGAACDAEGCD